MPTEEDVKRRMLDFVVADKDELDGHSSLSLADILKDIPKEKWGEVLFYYDEDSDYYGGTTVSCRFYTQRLENDEEYEKRLKFLREEEEKERGRAARREIEQAVKERHIYELLKRKYG